MKVDKGPDSDELRFRARHVLFVEGEGENSLDVVVLRSLLDKQIRIEPMGSSYRISSVAEALFTYHPDYYFLIDRDHQDDEIVEKCWRKFPDPATKNLLIWRRREIENYFLDAEYLALSGLCTVSQHVLEAEILRLAQNRIFLDAANYALITVREKLKRNWIEKYTNIADFPDAQSALKMLRAATEFHDHTVTVAQECESKNVAALFNEYLAKMTGGQPMLSIHMGEWPYMVQGKAVFSDLVNLNPHFFDVRDENGKSLQGPRKIREFVRTLVRQELSEQPQDFQDLRALILKRIQVP